MSITERFNRVAMLNKFLDYLLRKGIEINLKTPLEVNIGMCIDHRPEIIVRTWDETLKRYKHTYFRQIKPGCWGLEENPKDEEVIVYEIIDAEELL